MPASRHIRLFHPRLVRERVAGLDRGLFAAHRQTIAAWIERLRSGALAGAREASLRAEFVGHVFGDMLGHATAEGDGRWRIVAAETARATEGASDEGRVVAAVVLTDSSQFLEHAEGCSPAAIEQGWDDASRSPEARWIVVSNYRETRLYARSHGQAAYEVFALEELAEERGCLRFVALLGRDGMLGGPSPERSPLAEMLVASQRAEREVTRRLYEEYCGIRARLFEELRRNHAGVPAGELVARAQAILDRVLFVAFAEDRGLLPPGTLARSPERRAPGAARPVWREFLAVFRSIDRGDPARGIPAYGGGLFRELAGLEALAVSDEMCGELRRLGAYDYREDVSVDVLGHIFEQSISDLERLRCEAESAGTSLRSARRKTSKRRVEGIFYTPPFVTSFLVRETLGRAMQEAWVRAGGTRASDRGERVAVWEAYQNQLRGLRVLDPACGSGAFLVAVFDALAHESERVNRALAELRGQQTSLLDPTRTVLNENIFGIDRDGESVEISRLALWLKTAERGKPLTFLERNVRRGNSVVGDPAIDPWAFDWGAGRVARSSLEPEPPPGESVEAIDARWREGFDVVLGNPPYVRQELLAAYKGHWSSEYRAYDGAADLFVYFFERATRQLKPGGRLGFVVSNKWLRGSYAEKLRELLARECVIEKLVDFGHAPVFPDADAFPCVIILKKAAPARDHAVAVTLYPREELGKELLASYVESHRFPLAQSKLDRAGWTLEPPGVQVLLEKLRRNGIALAEYAGVKPFRGVLTGYNAAFLVDRATKERLCREDPRSATILKRYLRGQDVARWSPEWSEQWMIFARRGLAIDEFPAVKAHLERFRRELEPRPRDHSGDDWPGRKPGGYKWYEIQDSVDYYALFERPKIVYQELQFRPQFAVDRAGLYCNNKAFILPTDDPWLLAVLNSPVMWWHNWRYLVHMKDDTLSPAGDKMVRVPIPRADAGEVERVAGAVASIVESARAVNDAVSAVLGMLRREYEIEEPGQSLAAFDSLGADAFVREVVKRQRKGTARVTPAGLVELRRMFAAEAAPLLARRATIRELERRIAGAVHAAFGLDADDLALLRATAPPRMPPG